MLNADRYQWAKPGDRGEVRMVPVNDIHVDHSYQRDEVSERNTLAIAGDFQWSAFGTIVLMKRSDGQLVVVDGQQRLLAAKKRGDIDRVPAVIFTSRGQEHEATAFLGINCRRRVVDAVVKFKAAVLANLEPEKTISSWLEARGLKIRNDGKSSNVVDFPAVFTALWKLDEKSSKAAIISQLKISHMDPLSSYVHKGLWWLERHNIRTEDYAGKFIRLGGRDIILKEINAVGIRSGKTAKSIATCGLGILSLINHRKKSKISVSLDD